jgi:hypothetical protein
MGGNPSFRCELWYQYKICLTRPNVQPGCEPYSLEQDVKVAILINAALIATTIQAQDFKDIDGDLAIGRKTVIVLWPRLSRIVQLFVLPVWSLALGIIWRLSLTATSALVIYASAVGGRYLMLRTPKDDRKSFFYYTVRQIYYPKQPFSDLCLFLGLAFPRVFPPSGLSHVVRIKVRDKISSYFPPNFPFSWGA